jgi:hypothetical protein
VMTSHHVVASYVSVFLYHHKIKELVRVELRVDGVKISWGKYVLSHLVFYESLVEIVFNRYWGSRIIKF